MALVLMLITFGSSETRNFPWKLNCMISIGLDGVYILSRLTVSGHELITRAKHEYEWIGVCKIEK